MEERRIEIVSLGLVNHPLHPSWTVERVDTSGGAANDLVTWLRAQLDAAERGDGFAHCRGCEDGGVEFIGTMYECDIDTARARVLREVESKRAIIERCANNLENEDYGWSVAQPVLKFLALPFADRPGYQDEWRP